MGIGGLLTHTLLSHTLTHKKHIYAQFYYNFTLTPSAGTVCTGIPFGSDPTIDCGNAAGPAHVCVRCGGEIVVGLSAPGSINIGTVSLQPGPWGLLVTHAGVALPVLQSAGLVLEQMGVTLIRSGGSVSQSMRWKDWRGPQWNRPSLDAAWGASVTAGWGPFEVVDMCNALGIEPAITLAYDSNDEVGGSRPRLRVRGPPIPVPLTSARAQGDWADLVEYCWGDAKATSWGSRRSADGHPAPYNVTIFELGN